MVGSRERSWSTISQQLDVLYQGPVWTRVGFLHIVETAFFFSEIRPNTELTSSGLTRKCSWELIIRTDYYMLLFLVLSPASNGSLHRLLDQVCNLRNLDLAARHIMSALVYVL